MSFGIRDYYARQITVKEFGPQSVERLQGFTVAVIGTGGVGSAAEETTSAS